MARNGTSLIAMQAAPSSPNLYAGAFHHQLDDKNRVTIPARWRRSGEGEEFLLLPEQNGQCLLVLSPNEFARLIASAENSADATPRETRVFLRQVHARAQHGSIDKQGRLLLPVEFCQQLNLKNEIALVGGAGRFEIWNAARWKRAQQDEHATYQHVANLVGL